MGVIVFASLKGGVGKTSLSVNVAHAFAKRRCRTLLIDLDPAGHASRFFRNRNPNLLFPQSTLAKIFFEAASVNAEAVGLPGEDQLPLVRPDLELMPSGEELRHFLWGRGNQLFARYFPPLIKQLRMEYDHVVIDTPPDFNTLTRNSLAAADIAIVPVDASEMSIYSLEELLVSAQHLERPLWGICRTMVNKKAQKSQRLSSERLQERIQIQHLDEEQDLDEIDLEDAKSFVNLLQTWEQANGTARQRTEQENEKDRPIFLLRSLIYRTELQNQLTFQGRTTLDNRSAFSLAEQYLSVAKEVESLLAVREGGTADGGADPENEESTDDESTYAFHA